MEHLQTIKEAIKRVMGDTLLKEISEEDTLKELGCDSLDIVEITMEIEDDFFIEIPDVDLKNFKSIKDLIDYVTEKELHD